jgi:hypothetical protein
MCAGAVMKCGPSGKEKLVKWKSYEEKVEREVSGENTDEGTYNWWQLLWETSVVSVWCYLVRDTVIGWRGNIHEATRKAHKL